MDNSMNIIVDYVEGRLDIKDFKVMFESNKKLQKLLKQQFDLAYRAYAQYNYNVYDYLSNECPLNRNWDTIRIRFVVYIELVRYLDWFQVQYDKNYTKYVSDYRFLLNTQPAWLDITNDEGIFEKIIAEVPKDLSKTKQIAWGKARVKELFKFDKTYPRWVQSPEWPIVNGKPLVFSHQSKEKKDDERVYYYFYDPDTKEQTVVMQMY